MKVARAVRNGVRLGLLSPARQRRIDQRYYAGEELYRTAEWNRRGLTPWERAGVEAHTEAGARILVVGCGGGREVLGLLEAGYDAYGAESHPDLAAFAERFLAEQGHPGRLEAAARDGVPDGPPVDLVVLGWGAYSLIHGREARVAALRDARRRAGRVLLSGFGRHAHGRALHLTHRVARLLPQRRQAELGDTMAPNRVHVFTRAQLEREAADAGFASITWQPLVAADGDTFHFASALR